MLSKMKEYLLGEDVDVGRRKFIRTAAELTALTVVASVMPSALKAMEIKDQIASGEVYGQVFYISEPVVIDLDVDIRNCRFIAVNDMEFMMEITADSRVSIDSCEFDSSRYNIGACISLKYGAIQSRVSNNTSFSLPSAPDIEYFTLKTVN
jgi:hypothetical protein